MTSRVTGRRPVPAHSLEKERKKIEIMLNRNWQCIALQLDSQDVDALQDYIARANEIQASRCVSRQQDKASPSLGRVWFLFREGEFGKSWVFFSPYFLMALGLRTLPEDQANA